MWLLVDTLFRHDLACLPTLPVPGLALRVDLAATRSRLVPPVRSSLALSPPLSCAGCTAVGVAAVAAPADDDLRGVSMAVEKRGFLAVKPRFCLGQSSIILAGGGVGGARDASGLAGSAAPVGLALRYRLTIALAGTSSRCQSAV